MDGPIRFYHRGMIGLGVIARTGRRRHRPKYQARRKAKQASAARIAEKRNADLEITRIEAEISRAKRMDTADVDYDIQVLRNRERSWADEVLIAIFAGIFILPFVDALQATWSGRLLGLAEAVGAGWRAHGYDGAPWWFEFAMVGISDFDPGAVPAVPAVDRADGAARPRRPGWIC